MSEQIRALKIKAVGGQRSDDGQFGLIKFVRENPAPNGQDSLWLAIPNRLLAYLATMAIRQLPQASGGMKKPVPFAFPTSTIEFGTSTRGEYVVTIILEQGAGISYHLNRRQAEGLMLGLQNALGAISLAPPEGSKPN